MMQQRNLTFVGVVSGINSATCASVQGLWISTFLDGKIDQIAQTEEQVAQEIMLHTQWGNSGTLTVMEL